MPKRAMDHNRTINGTHGKVFWDGEKIANIKGFEAKATLNYEPIDMAEETSPGQKYMGKEIAGTMKTFKIDSFASEMLSEGINSGIMPEFTLIASLEDPASHGFERVEISGVTFDELTLISWENKTVVEEELPFKARKYRYLDRI